MSVSKHQKPTGGKWIKRRNKRSHFFNNYEGVTMISKDSSELETTYLKKNRYRKNQGNG